MLKAKIGAGGADGGLEVTLPGFTHVSPVRKLNIYTYKIPWNSLI